MEESRNIVRALERGLHVLTVLNQFNGLSILDIQSRTGYSRPGLYRILATLTDEGYVAVNPSDRLYRLTSNSRILSQGYQSDRWLAEIVQPIFQEIVGKIPWPVVLSVWRDEKLVVECTSASPSKITVRRRSAGWELRPFQSASGIVTMGLLPDRKFESLINEYAQTKSDPETTKAELQRRITDALENGYAIHQEDNKRSIAVPINYAPIAICTLAIFGEDSTKWTAKNNIDIVDMLLDLAGKIEMQLS